MSAHHTAEIAGDGASQHEDPNRIKKSSTGFIGSAVALSVGTAVAQAVAVLISPIISRLFDPEAFGLAALFGSVVGTVSLVGCLSYHLAIMLPKDDKTAANLFGLSLLLTAGITLLVALAIGLAGEAFLVLVKAGELAPYKWLIPAAVFLGAIILPLQYWNSRHNHFKRLGAAHAGAALVNAGATLGAGCSSHHVSP